MPNPSSDFAASFMISRSESLPITIATSGLSVMSLLFCCGLERSRSDVFPIVHAFELDERAGGVRALHCFFQRASARRYAEDASTGGDEFSSRVLCGAGVEDFDVGNTGSSVESGNDFAFFELSRISAGSDDHAARRVARPFEIAIAHASIHGGFEGVHE